VASTIGNGVDTATMFATLDLIKAQPELARFQFRAGNHWIDGAHNRSTIKASTPPAARTPPAGKDSSSTRASPRSCSAPTLAPIPPSTCCTPWRRA
jgi:hypothetical protein